MSEQGWAYFAVMLKFFTPGMRFMLLGTFLFSIGSLLVKMAGMRLPTMEILFIRGLIGIVFCWSIVRRAGVGMFGNRRVMLLLRGLVGFVGLFTEFYAIVHLPLADATALLFSHPMAVALLAWVVMGERLNATSLLAIFIAIAGVVVVCRPGFLFGASASALDPFAVGVTMGGVLIISVAILTIRTLAKTEHPAVVMFYPPLLISCLAPFFSEGWVMPTLPEWGMVIGVGLLMNAGQYYMTRGYAIESAARISAVTCLEVVFAAFWGLSILGEVPDVWTIGGGALIVVGVLVLGMAGDTPETPEECGQAQ